MCVFKFDVELNRFPHSIHEWGFSPVTEKIKIHIYRFRKKIIDFYKWKLFYLYELEDASVDELIG